MQAPGKNGTLLSTSTAPFDLPVVLVGVSVRSAAQSLVRGGQSCIAMDQFGDADTRQVASQCHVILSPDDFLQAIARYPGHPILCTSQWAGQWSGMIDAVAQSGNPLLFCPEAWNRATDLGVLRKAARQSGLSCPESTSVPPVSKDNACILVKDLSRSGGWGVRWAKPWGDRRLTSEPSPSTSRTIYQPWIAGRSFGATFLSDGNDVQLLGICRSLFRSVGDCPFVYCGSVGPLGNLQRHTITPDHQDRLLEAARSIVASSRLRGLLNLDFIRDPLGMLHLLEVNPRWTASAEIIERGLSAEPQSLMLRSMDAVRTGRLPERVPATDSQWIKRIVFARDEVKFTRPVEGKALDSRQKWQYEIHDLPDEGAVIQAGHPVCTLIARVDHRDQQWLKRYRRVIRQLQAPATSAAL